MPISEAGIAQDINYTMAEEKTVDDFYKSVRNSYFSTLGLEPPLSLAEAPKNKKRPAEAVVKQPMEVQAEEEEEEEEEKAKEEEALSSSQIDQMLQKLEQVADISIEQLLSLSSSSPSSAEDLVKHLALSYFWSGYYMARRTQAPSA